jgi:general stress protein YciG
MQVKFAFPDEFGNSGNQMYKGQNQGFGQNNQGAMNQGGQGQSGIGQQNQGNQNSGNGNDGQPRRRGRGFASMDPQRVSEIASMGGKAAHQQGVAHEWTPEEARRAGRKGGQASRGNGREDNSQSAGGSF